MMTANEAVKDTTTNLGRAAAQLDADREQRLVAARNLVAEHGITLEEAVARVWASVTFHA